MKVKTIKLLVTEAFGAFPHIKLNHTEVLTFEEANKIVKDCIDRETFDLLRALENNNTFNHHVASIRKEVGLPMEGLSSKGWQDYRSKMRSKEKYMKWELETKKKIREQIIQKVRIPNYLKDSIFTIVTRGAVYIPLTKISLEVPFMPLQLVEGDIKISINGKITKNQLLKFVENNWSTIEKQLDTLNDEPLAYVSERDLRIIRMRDVEQMTYKRISSILTDESEVGISSEDSVKKAYHRAKQRILSLTKGDK